MKTPERLIFFKNTRHSIEDAALREQLLAVLETQSWTPAIDVAVRNGVVQLSGIVTDERQRLGLLRRFSPTDLRMPPRGRRLRPSSALSIRIVLPHLRRRVPAVAKFGVPQW